MTDMPEALSRWRQDWGAAADEAILEPGRPLVDPHHHLWPDRRAGVVPAGPYVAEDLLADLRTGHRVVATVVIEAHAAYRADLPPAFAPVGETAFFAAQARALSGQPGAPRLAGMVAHVDLRLGAEVQAVLDAHHEAGEGLLRGVRQMAAYDPGAPCKASPVEADLYADPGFREGVRALGRAGLTFDAWHFHTQHDAFASLVAACPDTMFVLDHFGTPLAVGDFAGREADVFHRWRRGMNTLARSPNLVVKASGFTLAMVGASWDRRTDQPAAAAIAKAAAPWFEVLLHEFGPARCMFASNFPVEKVATPYRTLWNAFKILAGSLSESETDALCREVATRVYRLGETDLQTETYP